MSALKEGQHPGEFIVSLANHTRSKEEGKVEGGTELKDGTPITENSDGYLVAASGDDCIGLIIGDVNLSTDDEDKLVAYVAREAEVVEELLNFPESSTEESDIKTALDGLDIILR